MGIDVEKPGVNVADAERVGRGLGLGEERGPFGVGLEDGVQQARRAARRLLRDLSKAQAARDGHGSALGREVAGDDPEQSGLARPVAADEADPCAGRHRRGGAVQQGPAGDAAGDVGELKHGRVVSQNRRGRNDG